MMACKSTSIPTNRVNIFPAAKTTVEEVPDENKLLAVPNSQREIPSSTIILNNSQNFKTMEPYSVNQGINLCNLNF